MLARASLLYALLTPTMSWAGVPVPIPGPAAMPVTSELGLIAVGVSLLGVGGFALFRRRR